MDSSVYLRAPRWRKTHTEAHCQAQGRQQSPTTTTTTKRNDVEGGCEEEGACDAAQSAEKICACMYTHRPFECLLHGGLRCGAGRDLRDKIDTLARAGRAPLSSAAARPAQPASLTLVERRSSVWSFGSTPVGGGSAPATSGGGATRAARPSSPTENLQRGEPPQGWREDHGKITRRGVHSCSARRMTEVSPLI